MTNPEEPEQKQSDIFQKFYALPAEKQERIINAAMQEFLIGYKKASTDNIVREAGISKGILFHYFGTKENLYSFLIEYAIELVVQEYIGLINVTQTDILESIWQFSLLKKDLAMRFPVVFDFMVSVYVDPSPKSEDASKSLAKVMQTQAKIQQDVYANADLSLFRDEINPATAIQIIQLTLQGYSQAKISAAPGQSLGHLSRENYDSFLEEFQEMLNVFRMCFYK